jgi:hypothetical protein
MSDGDESAHHISARASPHSRSSCTNEMEGWSEYVVGVEHRHHFAHRAGLVTAEAFIADQRGVLRVP